MVDELEPRRSSSDLELERLHDNIDSAMGLRLRQFRVQQNLEQADVADRLGEGWNRHKIGRLERGEQPFAAEDLHLFEQALGVNAEWLRKGGELSWHVTDHLVGGIAISGEVNQIKEPKLYASLLDGYVMVPRLAVTAGMGPGFEVESESVVDHLAFRQAWLRQMGLDRNKLCLIDCKGDSMAPTILPGDMLLLDLRPAQQLVVGIYALLVDGALVVKRLEKLLSGIIQIISDNQAYRSQTIEFDRLEELKIIGRAVWFGRTL